MQLKKEKIKRRIQNAAREDFLEYGFTHTSMRNIAKKAQISTSNIYNYFESKEELFYSLINPVHDKIKNLLFNLLETEKIIGENEFFRQISNFVAHPISKIIKESPKELIILMDRSEGTIYDHFKENLIMKIESHFNESTVHQKNATDNTPKFKFVMHIIANNFLEGLLELAKHYKNEEWVDSNIDLLIKYHINGISGLFN